MGWDWLLTGPAAETATTSGVLIFLAGYFWRCKKEKKAAKVDLTRAVSVFLTGALLPSGIKCVIYPFGYPGAAPTPEEMKNFMPIVGLAIIWTVAAAFIDWGRDS